MRFKCRSILLAGVAVASLALAGCAKSSTLDEETDSASNAVESVTDTLNSSLSDGEQSTDVASNGYRSQSQTLASATSEWLLPSAQAAACGLNRYSPAVGSSSCAGTLNNNTVTSSLSGCTVGASGQFPLSGTLTLSFDSASTCDSWINGGALPTSGYVVRTSSDFARTNPNGGVLSLSSDSHTNYLNETLSGGVKTTFGASSRSVEVLGLHRLRVNTRQRTVFDHSIHSLSPIVSSGTQAAGTRSISSGSIRVDHNLAKYSMTTTLAGLSWTSNCCHPVTGTLTFSLSGSMSGTMTADFNTGTCGEINLTKSDGTTEKVQLSACD